jgi:hypothetical protein
MEHNEDAVSDQLSEYQDASDEDIKLPSEEVVNELPVDRLQPEQANITTKATFLALVDNATTGNDLLRIIDLLPNSPLKSGHSITMNAIIKLLCRHSRFQENASVLMVPKIKKGVETMTTSTFTNLSNELKTHVRNLVSCVTPVHGPWLDIKHILRACNVAFEESVIYNRKIGAPANRIACMSHMLCDERVRVLLVTATENKPISTARMNEVFNEMYQHYEDWQQEYINPFVCGNYAAELSNFEPHNATFKDGSEIKQNLTLVINKVDSMIKTHKKNVLQKTDEERIQDIRNSFFSPKCKDVEIAFFYAFMLLENQDLGFALIRYEDERNVNAKRPRYSTLPNPMATTTTGLAHTGPPESVRTKQRVVKAPVHSLPYNSRKKSFKKDNSGLSDAKEKKAILKTQRKLLCYDKEIDHHRFVLKTSSFTNDEKETAKIELYRILNEIRLLREQSAEDLDT